MYLIFASNVRNNWARQSSWRPTHNNVFMLQLSPISTPTLDRWQPLVSLLNGNEAPFCILAFQLGGRWHLVRMKLSHKLTIAFRQLLLRHRRRVGEAEQLTTFTHRSAKLKQKPKSYRHAEIHIGSALDNFVTLTFWPQASTQRRYLYRQRNLSACCLLPCTTCLQLWCW